MIDQFDDEDDNKPAGLPGWMATFADMMALLMCFFVLLLSYSEMDAQKFKRIAGAMRQAFGVQNEIHVEDIPKGTSPIFDDFTPGKPDPTPIKQIEQLTRDSAQQYLDRSEQERLDAQALEAARDRERIAQQKASEKLLHQLRTLFNDELNQGTLELELLGQQIIFRIHENGAFGSASAFLQPRFKPVIRKIAQQLNNIAGAITVAGHTDNQAVNTELFDSNWDLSAKRAVAVATEMSRVEQFNMGRITVSGHASNVPLIKSNSIAARRKNRRVEISVMQGKAAETDPLRLLD
ncbi:MAG: chemotaxis protein MotB [Phenylobacterium sp.]|jgi:chemotaxis protein MotB